MTRKARNPSQRKRYLSCLLISNLVFALIIFVVLLVTLNWLKQKQLVYQDVSSFAKLCVSYVQFLLILVMPLALPIFTVIGYKLTKSVLFAALMHTPLLVPIVLWGSFRALCDYAVSIAVGLIVVAAYILSRKAQIQCRGKISAYLLSVVKYAVIYAASLLLGTALFCGYLYAYDWESMGYIIPNEYSVNMFFYYAMPIMLFALFMKFSKKNLLIGFLGTITMLSVIAVKLVLSAAANPTLSGMFLATPYKMLDCVSPFFWYTLFFFIAANLIMITKAAANAVKKFTPA